MKVTVGDELPADLRAVLEDAGITIPRDTNVWQLIGEWQRAKASTESTPAIPVDEVGEDFRMACEIDRAWNDGYAHGRGAAPATVETWARTLGLSPALVDRWLDGKNLLLGTSPRAAIAEGRVEEVFDVLAAFAAGRTPDA